MEKSTITISSKINNRDCILSQIISQVEPWFQEEEEEEDGGNNELSYIFIIEITPVSIKNLVDCISIIGLYRINISLHEEIKIYQILNKRLPSYVLPPSHD